MDLDQKAAKRRVKALREQIEHHNRRYFAENNPEITDYEYDLLLRELKDIESRYPALRDVDSPTQTAGYHKKEEGFFQAVKHPYPMTSLENAMDKDEVKAFIERREKDLGVAIESYSILPKYDGLAVELIYRDGKFVLGSTRGNGDEGEDITVNLRTIENLPKEVPTAFKHDLVVRGEVIMTKQGFELLNQERQAEDLDSFAQVRSAAAGSLRQLDAGITRKRDLHFYAYQLAGVKHLLASYPHLTSHSQQVQWLADLGFDIGKDVFVCRDFKAIEHRYQILKEKRDHLPYELDGIVIKIDSQPVQDLLGVSGKRPRYAIAWKFPPLIKETILRDVTFQIGRTGVITPVAELDPVIIGGATVRRATLHNQQEIRDKDLRIGDWVEIIRSGDVIPKVLRALTHEREGHESPIQFPERCPRCQDRLVQDSSGAGILIRCVNVRCSATLETRFSHFVSKDAMNIEGMGKEVIKELLHKGLVKRLEDIYRLQAADFDQMDRMGDTLRQNLLDAIETSKRVLLPSFIFALGIRGVGLVTAKLLAKKYPTIDRFLTLTKDELHDINEIGDVLSDAIHSYVNDPKNQSMIRRFIDLGLRFFIPQEPVQVGALDRKRILFTGTLRMPRRLMKEQAERHGAELSSTVSKDLDYLIVGDKPGSKLKKAKELNIPILNEQEFLTLINFKELWSMNPLDAVYGEGLESNVGGVLLFELSYMPSRCSNRMMCPSSLRYISLS